MAVGKGPASRYNRRLRIERKVAGAGFDSAGSEAWAPVKTVWASVLDVLPGRAEKLGDGINMTTRPARVRMRFRTDVDGSMRFNIGRPGKDTDGNPTWISERLVQIVSGPAEVGFREEVEFMVEQYSPAGGD